MKDPLSNADMADRFREAANLLEREDVNPYRVRTYRVVASTLDGLDRPVAKMIDAGEDLTRLPGVGPHFDRKIRKMVKTGRFPMLEALRQQKEPILALLMDIPGIGPKRALLLRDGLSLATEYELEAATREGRTRALRGIGKVAETAILDHLARTRPPRRAASPQPAKARPSHTPPTSHA